MADLAQTTVVNGTPLTSGLTGLTEHGQVKIYADGLFAMDIDLDGSSTWVEVFNCKDKDVGRLVVIDYLGTALRIRNVQEKAINVKVGQVA